MISLIGFLCMLYSYEYMIHDDAQGRYYFWMLTFLASMLLLVMANSPLVLLLAWELTGLCSFSLIAHWNFKRSALSGAYKALVITELGSGFLLLGLVLANVHELSGAPSAVPLAAQLLVLIGALAKSAQYPLLRARRRSIDELGGLASQMPLTAAVFTLGALSLSGVPPLGGFSSGNPYAWISGSRGLSLALVRDAFLALTIISLYLRSGELTLAQAIKEVAAPHALLLFAFFALYLLFSSLTTLFSAPLAETEILEGYLLEYSGPLLALAELSHWLTSYAVAGIASAAALRGLGLWLEGLAPLMHLLTVILLAFLLASADAVFARLRIWGSVKLAALTLGFFSTVSLALSIMRW